MATKKSNWACFTKVGNCLAVAPCSIESHTNKKLSGSLRYVLTRLTSLVVELVRRKRKYKVGKKFELTDNKLTFVRQGVTYNLTWY